MIPEIKEWTQEEAESWFNKIEENKGREEWYDIELKEKLNFDDTGFKTNNTTQKVISGFANTYGGNLIIGFNDKGEFIGTEEKSNIENFLVGKLKNKLQINIPYFKLKYYPHNNGKILVIFVARSKKPIRCDNGVYYYREQSQFLPMSYEMLNTKFRENFEEEKYIYLVKRELNQIIKYCEDRIRKCQTTIGHVAEFDFSAMSKYLLESGDKLYNFYMENKILGSYSYFVDILTNWLSGVTGTGQFQSFVTFKEQTENFLKDIGRLEAEK
jgi:hypothetical protein